MSNYQVKVNNTQQYSDSQGEHIVCKGKLVLINRNIESDSLLTESVIGYISKREGDIIYDNIGLDPIIISETEEIEEGELYLNLEVKDGEKNPFYGKIYERNGAFLKVKKDYRDKWFRKILALPEHFSDKHLQAIVDGKIKNGDEVLVKCDMGNYWGNIHLDQNNHITLFPAKQSLEEASLEYTNTKATDGLTAISAFEAGAKWAKENNY